LIPLRVHGRAWLAILLTAMLARFVFAGWVVGFDAAPKGDEIDYHAIAAHLSDGRGFVSVEEVPTARRPPAYPALLAALYTIKGPSPTAGRIAQVVLGVLVVALTGLLARRLFDPTTARIAGLLAALNPFLVFISGYLLTENLYLIWILGALAVAPAPHALASASWRRTLAAAAMLGLATLSRPTGLPMFEWVVVAFVLLGVLPWRRRIVRAFVLAFAFALVVTPWCARNARVVGGWVLTTHGGITFYQGNNEKVANVPQWRGGAAPLEVLPRMGELSSMPELARDRLAWSLGREYLTTHESEVPRVVAWKLVRFWRLKSDMGLSGIRSGWWWKQDSALGRLAAEIDVGLVYAVVVLPLFVAGLVLTRRRWREMVFLYGVISVHTAVAAVFFGSLRARIPVEPVMCVFAAAAAVALVRVLKRPARATA
jgi:4-amino-4-deoxy-L-arabinose transferase-like glycosyltransferase